jgi:hypothetical protein
VHALSEEKSDESKDSFYEELEHIYENVTRKKKKKSGEREYFQANNWTGESPSG